MNKKLGLSLVISDKQLKHILNKTRHRDSTEPIIIINTQIQILQIYDKPVLFVSTHTNIESFLKLINKYKQMLIKINCLS